MDSSWVAIGKLEQAIEERDIEIESLYLDNQLLRAILAELVRDERAGIVSEEILQCAYCGDWDYVFVKHDSDCPIVKGRKILQNEQNPE